MPNTRVQCVTRSRSPSARCRLPSIDSAVKRAAAQPCSDRELTPELAEGRGHAAIGRLRAVARDEGALVDDTHELEGQHHARRRLRGGGRTRPRAARRCSMMDISSVQFRLPAGDRPDNSATGRTNRAIGPDMADRDVSLAVGQNLDVIDAAQARNEHRQRIDHPCALGDDARTVLLIAVARSGECRQVQVRIARCAIVPSHRAGPAGQSELVAGLQDVAGLSVRARRPGAGISNTPRTAARYRAGHAAARHRFLPPGRRRQGRSPCPRRSPTRGFPRPA
jgi:hypothetical protein